MSPHVSTAVVVPVYDALDRVTRCLKAVSRTIPSDTKVLVINDASPDPRVQPTLERLAEKFDFDLLANPSNLGFIGTCNRAFAEVQDSHVLLLNSDTEPYAGWFESMVEMVADDVASVTAISNNASIYSVPGPGIDPFSRDFRPRDLARLVRERLPHDPIEIPVAVGFCMLLTRHAIDYVGVFDPAFGQGYGEENDWCMRASIAGFRHLLAPGAFVLHEGGASMSLAGVLSKGVGTHAAHEAIVTQRYPNYHTTIDRFLQQPQIHVLRETIAGGIIDAVRESRPRVLHWLHSDPMAESAGGTELSVRGILQAAQRTFNATVVFPGESRSLSVREWANGVSTQRRFDAALTGLEANDSDRTWQRLAVGITNIVDPSLAHVHHAYGTSLSVVEEFTDARIPTVLSLHDFHIVCPRNHLFDRWDTYCGIPREVARCDDCVGRSVALPMRQWRRRAAALLERVDVITVPSQSVVDLLSSAVPLPAGVRVEVIPPVPTRPPTAVSSEEVRSRHTARRVLIPGHVDAPHKGGLILADLVRRLTSHHIEVHTLGTDATPPQSAGLIAHGTYRLDDLAALVTDIDPDFAIIPSIVPETYSMTLSEMWANGVPVLARGVGAIAARIAATGAGWLVSGDDAGAFAQAAIEILLSTDRLELVREAARRAGRQLAASPAAADSYLELYRDLLAP